MLARIGLLALAAGAAPSGCERAFGDGTENAHHPGHDLGAFQVTGTLNRNTCGEGALGEQPTWAFTVHLARDTGEIYWDNGQAVIPGTLAADGVTFSIDSSVVMNMRSADQTGLPPCSVSRADHVSGTLGSAADPVTTFKGDIAYAFSPTAGSSCDDLTSGPAAVVAGLPCQMSYALSGQKQ